MRNVIHLAHFCFSLALCLPIPNHFARSDDNPSVPSRVIRAIPMDHAVIEAYFSPRGGCTDAIIREIACANKDVRLQGYSFTSKAIAQALIESHRRGVSVEIVLDDSNKNPDISAADDVADAGIPVWLDGSHAIHHNKIVIVDGKTVITGSFNFSKNAELSNAENLVVVHDGALARRYLDEYQKHRAHSRRLKP